MIGIPMKEETIISALQSKLKEDMGIRKTYITMQALLTP